MNIAVQLGARVLYAAAMETFKTQADPLKGAARPFPPALGQGG